MRARGSSGRSAARAPAIVLVALTCSACSAGDTITLGRALPDPIFGDEGRPVANINENGDDEAPTLTEDLLQIYFSSRRPGPGNGDIWFARRRARTLAFESPDPVLEVNTEYQELSPAISRDGLTLWVASDQPGTHGGLDIWRTERASREAKWGPLENVSELNSTSDDVPRPLGASELDMPLASRREGTEYQIYLAHRVSPQAPFVVEATPTLALRRDGGMAGGFLTEDGLTLLFHREGQRNDELYLAWRRSLREPFESFIPLASVPAGPNGAGNDRDPFVSSDHTRFFFSSNRQAGTGFDIFGTTLDLPVFE